jgi:hypothetical protein
VSAVIMFKWVVIKQRSLGLSRSVSVWSMKRLHVSSCPVFADSMLAVRTFAY